MPGHGSAGNDETVEATPTGSSGDTLVTEEPRPGSEEVLQGDVVGRYVVLSRLGSGGMGVVYAAYDPELDRKVALKLIRVRRGKPARVGARRLLREAQAMAKLNHPNVIAVHDVGEQDGRIFLAMAFVEGETLRAWSTSRRRDWAEVLEAFSSAGRGLAAAHAKGLVHRDFKPENVMVDRDGRVFVLDFGLARSDEGEGERETAAVADGPRVAPTTDALNSQLTKFGAIVGTPAYMSPEQHFGIDAGPAADQFSFCVALYEGLYGERPFRGDTVSALAYAVSEGKIEQAPVGARVPAWLRRAVVRGLESDPKRRWPSMDALLHALAGGQRRAWRRRAGVLASVAALGVGGAFAHRALAERRALEACTDTSAEFVEAWDADAVAEISAAFERSGVANAEATRERVIPWLDRQAVSLRESRHRACVDSEIEDRMTPEQLDRVLWCLDERKMEFEALVDELGTVEREGVQRAVKAASTLSRVAPCLDQELLARLPAPPESDRHRYEDVRRQLSRAKSLRNAGRYDDSVEVATTARTRAEALAWPPLTASADLQVGLALLEAGDYESSEVALQDAFFVASESGALRERFDAAVALMSNVGSKQAQPTRGLLWSRHAEAALGILGEDELGRAEWLNNTGVIHWRLGQFDRAFELYEQALKIREAELGTSHPLVAMVINNMANVRATMGEFDEAKALYERSMAIKTDALGATHPEVAGGMSNMAIVYYSVGDYANSTAMHAKALEIREQVLGEDHPDFAAGLNNYAAVLFAQKRYAEAEELYGRTLAIREKKLGANHPDLASALHNLALTAKARGNLPRARELEARALSIREDSVGPEHHEYAMSLSFLANLSLAEGDLERARKLQSQALEIRRKALGPEHAEVAVSLASLGGIDLRAGDLDKARENYRAALAINEAALGGDHLKTANNLVELATVTTRLGERREAVALAKRALGILERSEAPAVDVAEAEFVLAKAHWGDRDSRAEARALAEQAAGRYRAAPPEFTGELAEVEAWLSSHR